MTFEKWVEFLRLTEAEVEAADALYPSVTASSTVTAASAAADAASTAKRARTTSDDEPQGNNHNTHTRYYGRRASSDIGIHPSVCLFV